MTKDRIFYAGPKSATDIDPGPIKGDGGTTFERPHTSTLTTPSLRRRPTSGRGLPATIFGIRQRRSRGL